MIRSVLAVTMRWLACVILLAMTTQTSLAQRPRWTEEQANDWYQRQPWLVGANYTPANAINQLEMWQAETFDPGQIDKELGWAENLGMNTMRVFLHDLLWQQDPEGFKKRIDAFLTVSAKHHIRPLFVLFDSCWDPEPKLGPQHAPVAGVHNSGWVQSPSTDILYDPAQYPKLEAYVKGVIGAFANDSRILGWDLWNEPSNTFNTLYRKDPLNKAEMVTLLLPKVFEWARMVGPSQPITSGIASGSLEAWKDSSKRSPIERTQLEQSDVISFHNYGWPEDFEEHVVALLSLKRPLLCTEYMARGTGSTFDTILPLAKKYRVAAFNWGLVAGKTQTQFPWESWQHPYVKDLPPIWFHDVLYPDGHPYREREAQIVRELTKVPESHR